MLSCTFSMFWTTVTSQTSSEKRRTNRHTVKPTVMFGSRAGFAKGSHTLPCFHTFLVFFRSRLALWKWPLLHARGFAHLPAVLLLGEQNWSSVFSPFQSPTLASSIPPPPAHGSTCASKTRSRRRKVVPSSLPPVPCPQFQFPVPSSLSQVPCPQFADPRSFPVPSSLSPVCCPQFHQSLPPVPCPQFPVPSSLSPVCCPQFLPASSPPVPCRPVLSPHFPVPSSLSPVCCPQFPKTVCAIGSQLPQTWPCYNNPCTSRMWKILLVGWEATNTTTGTGSSVSSLQEKSA